MNKIRFGFALLNVAGMILFCSCATPSKPVDATAAADLPVEVAMRQFSSRAPRLMVRLHLENGAEFNCFVDTGSPGIVLPKFLEPRLGNLLFKHGLTTLDGDFQTARIYNAPKIYLGETALVTGDRVLVWDHLEGVLGMDCLRHYRVQLDFQTEKIRFLKSGDTNEAELGKAYPLTSLQYAHIRQNGFFQGNNSALLIDTGDPFDGMMSTKLLRRAVRQGKAAAVPIFNPPNFKGKNPELARFPTCVWDGQTYTNLLIQAGDQEIMGLKFLARHQVTFDFPKRVMYLKYLGEGDASAKDSAR